jgi:hypothetical protein
MQPEFPISILLLELAPDGMPTHVGLRIAATEDDLANELEWFDSDVDEDGSIFILDNCGHAVDVKVEAFEIKRLGLKGEPRPEVQEWVRLAQLQLKAA